MIRRIQVFLLFALLPLAIFSQGYKKPPKKILDVLNAPRPPVVLVSPAKDRIALFERVLYPPVADLAEPMLRLAGVRINPLTNSRHRVRYFRALSIRSIRSGGERNVLFPKGARLVLPNWSPDGRYIAVGNIAKSGVELWIVETATGKARRLASAYHVNTILGGFEWMPGGSSLVVRLVPGERGTPPETGRKPGGPSIQETTGGRKAAIRTYQDLLKSPSDEKLFEYYALSQIAVVSLDGAVRPVGRPGIYSMSRFSPDGRHLLTERIVRPYSYLFPFRSFPKEVEVWDRAGKNEYKVASIPLQDNLPVQGVPVGRRSYGWVPTEPATLMWVEALDGGDPRRKISPRDRILKLAAPFGSEPSRVVDVGQRYSGRLFGEKRGSLLFFDYNRDNQHRRIFMADYLTGSPSKLISDINRRDRYNNIGTPVTRRLPNGQSVVVMNGRRIFLYGRGATPDGDRPFLREMDLETLKTEELFRSGADSYETFLGFADKSNLSFLTQKESKGVPPNVFLNYRCPKTAKCDLASAKRITDFRDRAALLRGITKRLVRYKRADGVDLSFTLYLPPGYKKETRLPTIVWAYPREYTDRSTAGQVSGSPNRYTTIRGYSHLFLLLEGYAILDNATMPIVGDPLTVNDTFIEQLVASAKAAIDKGAEIGVVDPDRVGVGGHSYGAFMTAHLLARSDLFRAGIARSGAYNRTLTPFGFQAERRSFWQAPEAYFRLSPFMAADRINEPMLMIHGEADNNSGTYPMQSRRMFAAIQGNGGTARLVMLPYESHGYTGRESIEHTLWEMVNWMNRYVKNAKPRAEAKLR